MRQLLEPIRTRLTYAYEDGIRIHPVYVHGLTDFGGVQALVASKTLKGPRRLYSFDQIRLVRDNHGRLLSPETCFDHLEQNARLAGRSGALADAERKLAGLESNTPRKPVFLSMPGLPALAILFVCLTSLVLPPVVAPTWLIAGTVTVLVLSFIVMYSGKSER